MSTKSNITVLLKKEDYGKTRKFSLGLIRHPFVRPDYFNPAATPETDPGAWPKSLSIPAVTLPDREGAAVRVFCRSDGYPDGVGRTLLQDFPDYETALNLVLAGTLTGIVPVFHPDRSYTYGFHAAPKLTFAENTSFPCIDTDATDDPKETFIDAAYRYLFKDGQWLIRTADIEKGLVWRTRMEHQGRFPDPRKTPWMSLEELLNA